jgi:succinoglycan biosynthesis transport protein ExoP
MNPQYVLLILRDRWKIVLLVLLLSIAAGGAASYFLPKRYVAETTVLVDIKSPDPAAVLLPSTVNMGTLATQAEIIKSDRVARKVVRMLGLDDSPAIKRMWIDDTKGRGKLSDWTASLLQKGVRVDPSRESSVITIAFQGGDPAFVATVANAYAEAYIEASVELKVEPARQYAAWFADQAKLMRESVERAQNRLSEFQREKGIVATDEAMDYELAKLNELSGRLTAVQGEARDSRSRQREGSRGRDTLPEVMQNPMVQELRREIIGREAKLKEMAANLGTQHPQYRRAALELEELKIRLRTETARVLRSFTATTDVSASKAAELASAIEAQKKKLLDMKKERDQIAVLARDVETAKRAYDAVTNRYNQANLESQVTRANVSVLAPAIEPLEPVFPKPLAKMLLMAAGLGLFLGGAAALGLEMIDRRIRSAHDLEEMLQLPVLAVIERRSRPGRLVFRSRALPAPVR